MIIIIIIIIIILVIIIIIITMGVSPPLLLRCHNHSRSVVRAGPRVAPLRMRGVACDAFAEASMVPIIYGTLSDSPLLLPLPSHLRSLQSQLLAYSFLFHPGGSRTIPHGILLYPLSSFPTRHLGPSLPFC